MISMKGELISFKVRAEHQYGPYYREASAFGGVIVVLGVVEIPAEVFDRLEWVVILFLE